MSIWNLYLTDIFNLISHSSSIDVPTTINCEHMSTNKAIITKTKKIETSYDHITLHASLIPMFLCEIDNYLLTLKGNHHPISISNDKFISGTRDIGSPKNISEHSWDNSMTVFPFLEKPPSSQQQLEMKLPLQPLLPLQRLDIETMAQLSLLPENSDQLALPDTTHHGYTLKRETFDQNLTFLKKLEDHSAVDGESGQELFSFLFAYFGDQVKGNPIVELKDGTIPIDITQKEDFIKAYNNQPARYYQAIRQFLQTNTSLRFAMIDGQHRSFGLYL